MKKPKWLADVAENNYSAAESFLRLLCSDESALDFVTMLRVAHIVQFKAKDIFRASQLSLLGVSNSHVEKDSRKIEDGISLSPILLVRDEPLGRVVIADGYHRLCAVYGLDEDAWIPCKIV